MPTISVVYCDDVKTVEVDQNTLLGDAVAAPGLPLEQPCAGRGTCGKCRDLVEGTVNPPDEVELKQLSSAELAAGCRLVCRARVQGDISVTLAPILVASTVARPACEGVNISCGTRAVDGAIVKVTTDQETGDLDADFNALYIECLAMPGRDQ